MSDFSGIQPAVGDRGNYRLSPLSLRLCVWWGSRRRSRSRLWL